MNQDELKIILEYHGKWLRSEAGGRMADLSGANLSGANLSGANLSGANLSFRHILHFYNDPYFYSKTRSVAENEVACIAPKLRPLVSVDRAVREK
jgi:hypothetical protein